MFDLLDPMGTPESVIKSVGRYSQTDGEAPLLTTSTQFTERGEVELVSTQGGWLYSACYQKKDINIKRATL